MQDPGTQSVQNKKNSHETKGRGLRIHSCDFIELPATQNYEKRVSRYREKNMSSASEYSEASECEPLVRESVQKMIQGRGDSSSTRDNFVELPPSENNENASRGIVKNMSSASEYSKASGKRAPPGRTASKTKKRAVARRQGQGADMFFSFLLYLPRLAV